MFFFIHIMVNLKLCLFSTGVQFFYTWDKKLLQDWVMVKRPWRILWRCYHLCCVSHQLLCCFFSNWFQDIYFNYQTKWPERATCVAEMCRSLSSITISFLWVGLLQTVKIRSNVDLGLLPHIYLLSVFFSFASLKDNT